MLPFGNRTVIETLTGAQLTDGAAQRVQPAVRDPAIATGRFPQVSGLKMHVPLQRHDAGGRRLWISAERPTAR